jgi:Flp pilus assembly protein TadD
MKSRFTIISIIALIAFSACTDSKWNQRDPEMPAEYVTQQEAKIQEHQDVLKEDPENIDSLAELGFYNYSLGNLKESEQAYLKVLELAENHYPALSNLATIYEDVEDYDSAANYIKRLYQNQPNTPEVMKDTVRILLKADDPAGAQSALENFARVRQADDDTSANQLISDLYSSINSYNQAHETQ